MTEAPTNGAAELVSKGIDQAAARAAMAGVTMTEALANGPAAAAGSEEQFAECSAYADVEMVGNNLVPTTPTDTADVNMAETSEKPGWKQATVDSTDIALVEAAYDVTSQ
jgi:hypothetical protein